MTRIVATASRRVKGVTGQLRKRKFTRESWAARLAELNGEHPHARHLREGIEEFRGKLCSPRDKGDELRPVRVRSQA